MSRLRLLIRYLVGEIRGKMGAEGVGDRLYCLVHRVVSSASGIESRPNRN